MERKEVTKKEKNFNNLVSALGNLYNRFNQTKSRESDKNKELAQCIIKAHEEWQSAENFFTVYQIRI